jgi:hypothetical protein
LIDQIKKHKLVKINLVYIYNITMFDWRSLLKYILEGLAVAIAMYLLTSHKPQYVEIILIALTAAAVFAVLDAFSPYVARGARQGSGFALGYQQVGFGTPESTSANNTPMPHPPEGICAMKDNVCTYHEDARQDQKDRFLCKQENDQCVPTRACKETRTCKWNEDADQLLDASGRACALVNNRCQMAPIEDTSVEDTSVENSTSANPTESENM